MSTATKSVLIAIGIAGAASLGAWALLSGSDDQGPEEWKAAHEGFLVVAAPDGVSVELQGDLAAENSNGRSARPATAAEALIWMDAWPYRAPGASESPVVEGLHLAARSREVRCTGAPTGEPVPQRGNEEETLEALRARLECTYAKWMVWSGETAHTHPNERHTVWADERGRFHGRVDYWR